MKFVPLGLSDAAVAFSDKAFDASFVIRVRSILAGEESD